jgi:hypothetical protein
MAGAPILRRSKTQDRLDEARIKKLELDLALKKGELVLVSDIESLWNEAMVAFRNKLLSLPQTLAFDLSECEGPEDIQLMLDREIRQALTELSETGLSTLQDSRASAMESTEDEQSEDDEDGAGGRDSGDGEEGSERADGQEGESEKAG